MGRNAKGQRDWYQVLGVPTDATPAEITAAYYALARDHHPDTSLHHDPQCRTFKEIVSAYEALSDQTRRARYDRSLRSAETERKEDHASRSDIHAELPISPEESKFGGSCEIRISYLGRCSECLGSQRVEQADCVDCGGKGWMIRTETVKFEIPRGVTSGTRLSLRGRGNESPNSNWHRRGTLHLQLNVRPCW